MMDLWLFSGTKLRTKFDTIKRCKTLLDYFIEHYAYLIPEDVILVDYNTETDDFEAYKFDSKSNMFIHFFADDFWKYLKEK